MHHRRRQGNMSSWRARPRVRKSQQEQVGNKSDLTLSLAVPCGPLRAARGPRPDASSTYSAVSCSDFISLKFFECVVLVRGFHVDVVRAATRRGSTVRRTDAPSCGRVRDPGYRAVWRVLDMKTHISCTHLRERDYR